MSSQARNISGGTVFDTAPETTGGVSISEPTFARCKLADNAASSRLTCPFNGARSDRAASPERGISPARG
ncbi:hypothetical protein ACSTJ4_23690, partial [Vibrio parahaemolyticus]